MVRIDERLVHGQVALVWSRNLGVDRILVVNDKAAADPVQTATLKMAPNCQMKCNSEDQEERSGL
ncbi:PTS sugar transporter subunit IIB [Lacticaseibacillus chiayiensis]|uniref:PTS sugar transporter subunit IIB n=1 Tax=Lacticaseibacillus chiayiensis TaxID=2100821 RepID=UPI001FD0367E|nr:PTS sugar transporter subunit IIB [Lacticaseibacillus chiayiensis]